eukprot:16447-Heterococcus_DN1.PRE.3
MRLYTATCSEPFSTDNPRIHGACANTQSATRLLDLSDLCCSYCMLLLKCDQSSVAQPYGCTETKRYISAFKHLREA